MAGSTRHDPLECPSCGCELDCSSSFSGNHRPPEPGDVTVCIKCASALSYGEGLSLTICNLDDLDPHFKLEIERVVRAVQKARDSL